MTWQDLCLYCGWFAVAETSPAATAPSPAVDATSRAGAAVDQAAGTVDPRIWAAAWAADLASNGNVPSMDTNQHTRTRALDAVLAEWGR